MYQKQKWIMSKVSEKEIQNRLRSLSNQKVRELYENLDINHYPILLMKEYKRRFGKKKISKKVKKPTKRVKR